MRFKGESNTLVRFVIPLKLIFQQWTFPHQNLARNLKIIGPQSENNFPRKYDVTLNDVIVPALCAGSCLKNKVLVHFYAFLCTTFNFKYDFLDTSTTLDAKILEYLPEGNF